MSSATITVGDCRLEILTQGAVFLGVGRVWIGETLVRSGRLPWRCMTQSFGGLELERLEVVAATPDAAGPAVAGPAQTRLRLRAFFRPMFTKMLLDHSMDPIHELGDWDVVPSRQGQLDMVFEPAAERIGGAEFGGFAFHYEYRGDDVALFYLYDMSSWELDGDIAGATAISQSSCSDPVAHFAPETAWSTEGRMHWQDDASAANPVMTHNLPRWASHQAFDYQYKGGKTLIGLWERVDLIRSVLRREAGKAELKTFDKYLFDQTTHHRTPAKNILLSVSEGGRTEVDQQNLWTWTMDEVHGRARAEFGLREEPVRQRMSVNYWVHFTMDSYYKDLLPAAVACGFKSVFVDNLNKSDMTEGMHFGNMCCSWPFETSEKLGGDKGLTELVSRFGEQGVSVYSWANPNQSIASPLFIGCERKRYTPDWQDWFMRLPDTRTSYMGAYIPAGAGLDLAEDVPRDYWTGCLIDTMKKTGHNHYLWDSFYNSAFMVMNFRHGRPRTHWRNVLAAMKTMQDAGLHFTIESFGPFGEVQHGCPASYGPADGNLFACYKIELGTGYTTIPSGHDTPRPEPWPAEVYYRILAHMSRVTAPLFYADPSPDRRVDRLYTRAHRDALRDYNENLPHMVKRFLQEDGLGVLWHNTDATRATLWNFAERCVKLDGTVIDVTAGRTFAKAKRYDLEAGRTYAIVNVNPLPTRVESV